MKKCLFAIVLLYPSQYASADATFKFNSLIPSNNQHTLTYHIKQSQLKYTDSSSGNDNIFDQKSQKFITINNKNGTISTISEQILNKQLVKLNQQRMQKLTSVEKELNKKLADKTDIERQTGETLISQLKYPEQYGEHNLLSIKPLDKSKRIKEIECQRYQLFRETELLKEYCLATSTALGLNQQEYQTLRGFYAFAYNMQSKIMIAMGNTRFAIVDYDQHKMPGVVIETISYKDNKIENHLLLDSVNSSRLNDSIFKLQTAIKTK